MLISDQYTTNYFFSRTHRSYQILHRSAVLAFESDEFYEISDIDLGLCQVGVELLSWKATPGGVTQIMVQSNQQATPLSRPQAELLAWKDWKKEFYS